MPLKLFRRVWWQLLQVSALSELWRSYYIFVAFMCSATFF